MSEDSYGLDKAARLAATEADEIEPPIRLEMKFPFEVAAFDPGFLLVRVSLPM
jgi:hypothetical protein